MLRDISALLVTWGLRDYGTATWEGGKDLYVCNQCCILYAKEIDDDKKPLLRIMQKSYKKKTSENVQQVVCNETDNKGARGSGEKVETAQSGTQMDKGRFTESVRGKESELERGTEKDSGRICDAHYAIRSPKGNKKQVHDGASVGDGETPKQILKSLGSGASQECPQARQSNRKSGASNKKNAFRQSGLSALQQDIQNKVICPKCKNVLLRNGCDHKGQLGGNTWGKNTDGQNEKVFKETCGKCGAKRIDNQLGLEKTPDCDLRRFMRIKKNLTEDQKRRVAQWLSGGVNHDE